MDKKYRTEEEWYMGEQKTAPGLFSTSPEWEQFDDYEVVKSEEGLLYVVPAQGAKMERYRPFEYYYRNRKSILLDFLTMAHQIERNDNEKSRARSIIRFASKYGLLGLFWNGVHAIEERKRRYDGHTLYIVKLNRYLWNDVHGFRDLKLYDDYARWYFPRLKPPYPNWRTAKEEFCKEYGEPVVGISMAARYMLHHVQKVREIEEQKPYPTRIKDLLSPPEIYNLDLDLDYNDGVWQLFWKFRSLLDALWVMQFLNIIEQKGQLRLCAFCGRPFIAKNPRQKFHEESCGNNYRQRKHRGKILQPILQPNRKSPVLDGINRQAEG